MVIKMVLTAILPISVMIIINHNKMLRSNVKKADELKQAIEGT